jgi:elongation factor Ts
MNTKLDSTASAQDISKLRATTGAGMLDCKAALEEAGGNMEAAADILRKKGIVKAAKRADKVAAEGAVGSYIHAGGSVGVLVEVNCETDFVARTDAFQNFVKDICLHVAAANPKYLNREMVPAADVEREKSIYTEQLKAQGKPESAIENIMKGKLDKYYEDMCLMDQLFIKDDTKKISQLLTEMSTETGEKISIRRFVRFELGEGIEKMEKNFAEEVAEQLKK